MNNEEYVLNKIKAAKELIAKEVGLKSSYSENDVFKMLTKFGYIENISLDDASMYLPSKGYNFDSISLFTKGFIKDDDYYKIYAIRALHHFNLFVVSFRNYIANAYYSVNISMETMDICYILEVMTNLNK